MTIPKAALIYLSGAVAEDTATADIAVGMGATDGVSQWAFATFADDGETTIKVKRFAVKDGCIILHNDTAITAKASFVSFIENGIRINWSAVSGAAHKGFVVFFSGPTLRAKVGKVEAPKQSPGTIVADVGFRSELLLVATNFLTFGTSEEKFGVSQGFYFTGPYTAKKAISPFAGGDGLATTLDSPQGVINRAHFTRNTGGFVAVDSQDGDTTSALRGAFDIQDITGDGFTAVASNGFAALKDFGYLALNFAGRARITRKAWNLSDKADGIYVEQHGAAQIENLEAVLAFPVAVADLGANANVGLFAFTGDKYVAVFGRGSAALATGTYEKSSFSEGNISFPAAVPSDSDITLTGGGWTAGFTGWTYTLSNGPNSDRTFEALVIGRLEECFPLSWHQAQVMENL